MVDILIVEDDDEIRETLRIALEQAGHVVRDAPDADTGLRMYDERRAELIIMDLIMPDKDGIEAIREIRQRNTPVKIIAISGVSAINLRIAKVLGADHVLEKPFRHEAILDLIETAMASE